MATSYMSTCFFFINRPPEESLHRTSRTFRAESDSRDHFSRIDFPPLLRKGGKWVLEYYPKKVGEIGESRKGVAVYFPPRRPNEPLESVFAPPRVWLGC